MSIRSSPLLCFRPFYPHKPAFLRASVLGTLLALLLAPAPAWASVAGGSSAALAGPKTAAPAGPAAAPGKAGAADATPILLINGKPVAVPVRVINGVVYVPLRQMMESVGVKVEAAPDGRILLSVPWAGGSGPLEGLEAPIGQWVFDGAARLKVRRLLDPAAAPPQWLSPLEEGHRLVAVEVEIRNGTGETREYLYAPGFSSFLMATSGGRSYAPAMDPEVTSVSLAPGAAALFTLHYEIPVDEKPKRLLCQVSLGLQQGEWVAVRLTPDPSPGQPGGKE